MISDALAERYVDEGWWDGSTLAARVRQHALDQPEAIAVVDETTDARVSYSQLWADACRVAAFLGDHGVWPGQVVSVQLPNWYETVAVDLGVLARGAVLNPLLPNYRARELDHILRTAGTKLLFTPDEFRGFDHAALGRDLHASIDTLDHHVVVRGAGDFWQHVLGRAPAHLEPATDPAALSEVIFTSGTEATPKGVMHTEHTTNCNVRSAHTVNELTDDDVVWMPSPIGHSTGLNFGVRLALYFGMKLVLQERWDAERAVELIERERCSYTLAATTFLTDLVAAAQRSDRDVSSLTRFGCGGAPVPPEIVRAGADAGINVLRIYGLTEALVVSWNRAESPLEKRMHTDGLALPEVELETRDGEVMVRGPNVCVGLFDDPERERRSFTEDGWLHTGDAGVIDDEGYLSIVGRKKEIIIRGGLNIAPREIEDLLCEIPAVRAAAVIGLPDERLGEITCACLVVDDDVAVDGRVPDLDAIVAFLRSRDLATYKLPQQVRVVSELPTTPSGKVRKNELRELILEARAVMETVSVEDAALTHGTARILTLARPNERNPLDHATVTRLRTLTEEADADSVVRAVIVTGAGPAFSAGGDLRAYIDMYEHEREFRAFLDEFRALNARLEHGRFVSIAMVNGPCVAGGLELALACDLITIADDARIGDGHLGTGQISGAGGSQRLVRALGVQRAKQLLITGRLWTGTEAAHAGLALFSVPLGELRERTLKLASELAVHSPMAEKHMKTLVGYAAHLGFEEALSAEQELVTGYVTRSHDAKEGLRAFLERRAPRYTGS